VVNSGDNLAFRAAFNNAAGYKSYLDFNGDGTINSADQTWPSARGSTRA